MRAKFPELQVMKLPDYLTFLGNSLNLGASLLTPFINMHERSRNSMTSSTGNNSRSTQSHLRFNNPSNNHWVDLVLNSRHPTTNSSKPLPNPALIQRPPPLPPNNPTWNIVPLVLEEKLTSPPPPIKHHPEKVVFNFFGGKPKRHPQSPLPNQSPSDL
jgi:hypothetical protein